MKMPTFAHDRAWDPTYGYTYERLLQVQPPSAPDDFDEFWKQTYAEARDVPLETTREDAVSARPQTHRVSVLRMTGLGGIRLGAWLVEPIDTEPTRFIVNGHGYGNPVIGSLWFAPNTVSLFMNMRGLGLSVCDGISNITAMHVINGIHSRDTYCHRGCTADVWTGATALLDLYPQATGRLEYNGGSFGGGIGAMAMPWDDRFVYAQLGVPSFGNHPLRVTLPCGGSGAAVTAKYERDPSVLDVLRYFDSAIHATRIKIPTHVDAALFDPAVPPPGQFCVYNAMTCPKQLFVRQAAHFDGPFWKEDDAGNAASQQAFRAKYFPK